MSVVPSQLPSAGGKNSVGIFGRRVSTDALLLAGASVVAIILLYRAGRPSAASAIQPVSVAGDGSTFAAGLPGNALIASQPPTQSGPTLGPGQLEVTTNPTDPRGVPIWSYDPAHQGIIGWLAPGGVANYTGTGPGFAGGEPGDLIDFGGLIGWVSGSNVIGRVAMPPAPAAVPTILPPAGGWMGGTVMVSH